MNFVRRTLDIDSETDARLRPLPTERGQDVAAVLAEAITLLCSTLLGTLIARILRKTVGGYKSFSRPARAVPLHEIKRWVESWGTDRELPRPTPRPIS